MTASGRDDAWLALAAALPLGVLVAAEHTVARAPGFPLDDSWIHLHFARNLAAGAGFVYNPGVPVSGSTAPLWTLLLAAGALVAGPTMVMVKTLGAACALGSAVLTRRAALAWGAPREVALVAGVLLLWTGPLAWGALSGMEVTLATLLVAAALLAQAHARDLLTAACAALAVLARPEALLLAPLLALGRGVSVRRLALFAAVGAVLLAPLIVFSYATVGAPYPATAAAKVEGGLVGWLGGMREPLAVTWLHRPWAFTREWLGWLFATHWLLPLALLPGVPVAWRHGGRALGVAALVLLAHPLGMALLAPYRGPAFQEGRYSAHLLPVAVLVLAVGVLARLTRRRRAALLAVLVLALVPLLDVADRYAWGVQNINAMQVYLGRWLDANTPPAARLAVNDIGAIAYFSRREVIDLMGLVTPDILPFRRQGESGVIEYVATVCPDYVVIFPGWFPRLASRHDLLEAVHRVRLERVEVSGGPEMVVYRLKRCTV